MFKKTLIAATAALSLPVTFAASSSAFAGCNGNYQPVSLDQGCGISGNSGDYAYRGSNGFGRHQFDREHARLDFHDQCR